MKNMPLPDPDVVCRVFSSMESCCVVTGSHQMDAQKAMELRAKTPSSFINGQWLVKIPMKSSPWIHHEEKPMGKAYWKNEVANEKWSNLDNMERFNYLEKLASTVEAQASQLADFESMLYKCSADKFLSEVVPFLSSYLRYYAGWAGLRNHKFPQLSPKGCVIVDVREAAFPLLEAVWALAPALAAGNTINVLARQRAESLLHLVSSSTTAGFPAGTVNVIMTNSDSVSMACIIEGPSVIFAPLQSAKQAGVDAFIHRAESHFSLHGRCHMLVLRKADTEAAVKALINEAVHKTCLSVWSPSEVLIEEHLYETFINYLRKSLDVLNASVLPASNWSDDDLAAIKRHAVEESLEVMVKGAAVFLLGGRSPEPSNSWEAERKSCPVSILPVRSHSEAISIVGSRPRTLSASIWTEDGALALEVATALKLGTVWVNQHGTLPSAAATFGSWNCGGGAQFGGKEVMLSFLRCPACDESAENPVKDVLTVKHRKVQGSEQAAASLLNLFYGGETRQGAQGVCLLLNKKEKPLAVTSLASEKDVAAAVSAAAKATGGWAAKLFTGRVNALRGLAEALVKQQSSYESLLAGAGCADAASRAQLEVHAARKEIFRWICLADKMQGKLIGSSKPGSCFVTRHALGVIAICGEGNALTSLGGVVSLLAPALILGNTVVLAAAESNPLPVLSIAHALLLHTPTPAGVINVLSWGVEAALAAHTDVSALWAGLSQQQMLSATFKRVWRLPASSDPTCCSEEWLTYQATKQKTVCL